MDRQLSQLTALVDQLMDAARISSGKIVLDWKDIDVVELVRTLLDDHARQLADAGLKLKASLPDRQLRGAAATSCGSRRPSATC